MRRLWTRQWPEERCCSSAAWQLGGHLAAPGRGVAGGGAEGGPARRDRLGGGEGRRRRLAGLKRGALGGQRLPWTSQQQPCTVPAREWRRSVHPPHLPTVHGTTTECWLLLLFPLHLRASATRTHGPRGLRFLDRGLQPRTEDAEGRQHRRRAGWCFHRLVGGRPSEVAVVHRNYRTAMS